VGGTSWVTRFAVRSSPQDFEAWAAAGLVGWTFDDVLPYFCRIEDDLEFGADPWHGAGGPIPVTRYPGLEPTDFEIALRGAFASNGFAEVEDHNRPGATGFGRMPRSSRGGARRTSADTYLAPEKVPSNLTVRADAPVDALLIARGEAAGVRLVDGTEVRAGWVVLCAGTYGSPLLLQRSGVGPAGVLTEAGVAVDMNLPGVGANLADHPSAGIDLGYGGSATGRDMHSLGTFRSSSAGAGEAPDLAMWVFDPAGDPAESAIDVALMTPMSRGSVRIRSADPLDPPLIELPGLRHDRDVDRLGEGLQRGRDIAMSQGLRRLCADEPSPVPADAAELRAVVHERAWSLPHTVGTCAMGPSAEAGAVVDASGSVHGVDRVSVVDASIIPTAPSGFPHLVTLMIAEKLSDHLSTVV
jgi:choline dehydrogenase-like flavoprotein